MKERFILIMFIFTLLVNCQQEQTAESRYNPAKAGAEIVSTIDINDKINFDSTLSESRVLLSFYNGDYYFLHNEKVTVINGTTFDKTAQFDINIKSQYPDYNSYIYSSFAVFNNKMLYMYKEGYNKGSANNKVFQTDLSGGSLKLMDLSNDFNNIVIVMKLGFNPSNSRVWINCISHYEFIYDKKNDTYTQVDKIFSNWCSEIFFINNNSVWAGYRYFDNSYSNKNLIIDKYDLYDYYTILKSVNLYYLDINENPFDLIFNDQYLEIVYIKDNRLVLSKLKVY